LATHRIEGWMKNKADKLYSELLNIYSAVKPYTLDVLGLAWERKAPGRASGQ